MLRRNILIASISSIVFILSYAVVTFLNTDFSERPRFNTSVLPGEFRLVRVRSLDSFMEESRELYEKNHAKENCESSK